MRFPIMTRPHLHIAPRPRVRLQRALCNLATQMSRCFKTWHKNPSGLWLVEMVEEALLQVPGCLPQDLLHQVPVPPTIFQLNLKFNEICNALVHHIFGQSQWNFAHLKMITLSWHVQNFVEISWAYFKTGHYKFFIKSQIQSKWH